MKKMLLVPLLIFSCSPKSEVEAILTEKGSKWIYSESRKFDTPAMYMAYMQFEGDSCINYFLDSGTRVGMPDHSGSWSFSGQDSLLHIMGNTRKVIGISGDTIFLKSPEGSRESMLVRYR